MDRRRIARLVRVQERMHRVQRGVVARAETELHLAATREERARAQHRIQAHAVGTQQVWSADELPRAAELAELAREAVMGAQRERAQRAQAAERAQVELQGLGCDLRRLLEVQRRLAEAERVRAARAEQRVQDEVAARMRRADEGPE